MRAARHRPPTRPTAVADFETWQADARKLDWAPTTLLDESPKTDMTPEIRHEMAYFESLPFIEKLFAGRSTVQAWEIRVAVAHGLTATGGGTQADIDAVGELIRKHGVRQDGEITPVEWFRVDGAQHHTVTTTLTKERELEFVDLAKAAAKDTSAAIPAELLDEKVRETGIRFTDEQTEAINRITQARFCAAIGVAGCGKSTLLKAPIAAWKAQGRSVYGIALGWNQADNLLDSGIAPNDQKAISVFFDAVQDGQINLNRDTVLVVDELGLLGTHQGLRLMRLQKQHNLTVVALGDGKQCAPIESGSALELSRRALGADQVPEILTTQRQTGREVEIVTLFRDGRAARRGRPGKKSAADAPPPRTKAVAKAPQKRAPGRPKASPAPAPRGTSGRVRKAGAAELTGQIQQILDELSELRGIQTAMQALDAKLDAILRQVEARGGRDPGDAVPPGVAVQSPAPLSTEDRAVLDKLKNEGPPAEGVEPQRSE